MSALNSQHSAFLLQSNSEFTHDEVFYRSLAHYFYYQKALYMGDFRIAEKILKVKEGKKVKLFALKIESTGSDKAWRSLYPKVLQEALKSKFVQNLMLREWLSKQSEVHLHQIQSLWGLSDSELIHSEKESYDENMSLLGVALVKVRSQLMAS